MSERDKLEPEWQKRSDAMAYSLRLPVASVAIIVDSVARVVRREERSHFRVMIQTQIEATSADTGHGKAQRAFARKLLEKLRELGALRG